MTVKKAILLARKTIIEDIEYLQHIKQVEEKDPKIDSLIVKIYDLVKTIVFNEICLCVLIIQELKSQNDTKKTKRTRTKERKKT